MRSCDLSGAAEVQPDSTATAAASALGAGILVAFFAAKSLPLVLLTTASWVTLSKPLCFPATLSCGLALHRPYFVAVRQQLTHINYNKLSGVAEFMKATCTDLISAFLAEWQEVSSQS